MQRAAIHVQSSGRDSVTGANMLVALFSEKESNAVYFLNQQSMSRLDAVQYISHGITKIEENYSGEEFNESSSKIIIDPLFRKGFKLLRINFVVW